MLAPRAWLDPRNSFRQEATSEHVSASLYRAISRRCRGLVSMLGYRAIVAVMEPADMRRHDDSPDRRWHDRARDRRVLRQCQVRS